MSERVASSKRRMAMVAGCVVLAIGMFGSANARAFAGARPDGESDARLLRALRSDAELGRCRCIVDARWLDLSYARIIVDRKRWGAMTPPTRRRLSARALAIAESTYLAEFASVDQYEEIFFIDRHGRPLSSYAPA